MFFDEIYFEDNSKKLDLFDINDGLLYGNMFKNEYKPYKNYKPIVSNSNDEKGNLLLRIYELDFAMNDLSLYLDLNPNDMTVYEIFKKYTEELNTLVKNYETKYGPMELCNSDYDSYQWVFSRLPFKGGNL